MRILCIGVLLAALLLAPMTVCAEDANVSTDESKTVVLPEAIAQEETSASLALLFGKLHSTLLMSSEEAFGYLLTGNESEKQAFYDEIVASEAALAAFEDASEAAGENESSLVAGYRKTLEEYGNMTVAADAMFASYETEGKPVQKDVMAFEDSIDAIFNATDSAWVEFNTKLEGPMNANASVRASYGRLLSAVEESYAYPVLGGKDEKEDAIAEFDEFDKQIALYADKFTDTSYDDLKVTKEEIQKAAEAMFATYERDGKVNVTEAEALETLVEKMNAESQKLFIQQSPGKTPVTEEIAAGNETVVNATT